MAVKSKDNQSGGKKPWEALTRKERVARLLEISDRCAALPVLDDRSREEILGYNENGTFD